MEKVLDSLRKMGFTDGEIKVYRTLLKLGKCTIGPISRDSGITPAKTYPVLEKLLKKGLIGKVKENKTQYFTPNQPERILTYLDEKRFEIEEKRTEIEKQLPLLRRAQDEEILDVRILKGLEGIKTFYEEHNRMLLKGKKVFKVFSFEDEWKKDEVKRFIGRMDLVRKELGIEVRVIANEKIKKYIAKDSYELVKMKFTKQDIPVGTVISGRQIALMTWKKEPVVIVIDSEEIGSAYERFFDSIWRMG